jgi:membrane-associated protease RseP (regulator of RpoE activity)
MLGITLTDFNEEIASQLGVPVKKGIRIDGTVEGMGAQAAGLEKDDVIVSMNGKPADDFPLLTSALTGLSAGDTTEVKFYRGGEKKTVMMELSRRPIPDIPDTAAELSQALEKKNLGIETQLNDFLDSITEEEANYKSSADDWSVKEILAHLIQGERFYHFYIAELAGNQERWSDDYVGNLEAFIDATVASYPTLNDMRDALKRARVETVLLIAHLPAEFVERKGSYWRLAYGALEGTFHDVAHIEQMKTAVEAARAQ